MRAVENECSVLFVCMQTEKQCIYKKENLISSQSFGSVFKRLKFYFLIRFVHRITEGS